MAIQFIGAMGPYNTTTNLVTAQKHPDAQPGDIQFMVISIAATYTMEAAPEGWHLLAYGGAAANRQNWLYMRMVGQDESGPYYWRFSTGGITTAMLFTYRGVVGISIDSISNAQYVVDDTICRAGGLTTSGTQRIIFFGSAYNDPVVTFTPPQSPGEFTSRGSWANGRLSNCWADLEWFGVPVVVEATTSLATHEKHAFALALVDALPDQTRNATAAGTSVETIPEPGEREASAFGMGLEYWDLDSDSRLASAYGMAAELEDRMELGSSSHVGTALGLMVELIEIDLRPFSYLDVILESEGEYGFIDVILEEESTCPGRPACDIPVKIYRPHPPTRHHKRIVSPVRR